MTASFRVAALLMSLVLLVPCFWHERIEAGDLSSHIYNSWLAQEIDHGRAPNLAIARQSTNVLFDLILSSLFERFGAQAAQRIAVSAAVLIFSWGAFALIHVVNGSPPWFLMPCVAMLAYGWTFHSGLFNFYLSAGLSLWALVLMWKGPSIRIALGAMLLYPAYVAHSLGFAWALAVILYVWTARRIAPRFGLLLFVAAISAVGVLRFAITARYQCFWSPHQVLEASAVDQVWTFGLKYWAISVCLALLWGFLFLRLSHSQSIRQLAAGAPFQLCLIMSSGILLIPTRIELPGYNAAFSFITERMTLLLGVLICVFLGAVKPAKWQTGLLAALALMYFSFLYVDTRALNTAEARVEALLSQIPAGQRVFSSYSGGNERIVLWPHAIDRACIGRCLSYNNYEPHSAAFRIRTIAENPLVVSTAPEHFALRYGGYVVKERDLPLYQLQICNEAVPDLCVTQLQSGDITRSFTISLLPNLW